MAYDENAKLIKKYKIVMVFAENVCLQNKTLDTFCGLIFFVFSFFFFPTTEYTNPEND